MDIPSKGDRLKTSSGAVFVVESVTDLTGEAGFQPGDDRFMVVLIEAAFFGDVRVFGYELMEWEFTDFCATQGMEYRPMRADTPQPDRPRPPSALAALPTDQRDTARH